MEGLPHRRAAAASLIFQIGAVQCEMLVFGPAERKTPEEVKRLWPDKQNVGVDRDYALI